MTSRIKRQLRTRTISLVLIIFHFRIFRGLGNWYLYRNTEKWIKRLSRWLRRPAISTGRLSSRISTGTSTRRKTGLMLVLLKIHICFSRRSIKLL